MNLDDLSICSATTAYLADNEGNLDNVPLRIAMQDDANEVITKDSKDKEEDNCSTTSISCSEIKQATIDDADLEDFDLKQISNFLNFHLTI